MVTCLARLARMAIVRPLLLTWAETVVRAALFVLLGVCLDALLDGRMPAAAVWVSLCVLVLLSALAAAISTAGQGKSRAREEQSWHRRVLDTLFRLGTAGQAQWLTGRVVSTATDAAERAANYRATVLGGMIAALTAPVLVLVVIAVGVDPLSAALLCIPVPLAPVIIGGFQSAFRSVSKRYREASRRLAGQFLESIQGLGTLRLLGASQSAERRLAEAAEAVRRRVMALLAGNQIVILVGDAVFSLGFTLVALTLAVTRVSDGAITGGQGLALFLLSLLLLDPLERIGAFFYVGMGGIAAQRELRAFCAVGAEPEQPGRSAPAKQETVGATLVSIPAPDASIPSAVRLEDVGFRYGQEGPVVLAQAKLQVGVGEHLGVVGRSGAGKSTVLDLIQGILSPQSGRIFVSGRDLAAQAGTWAHTQATVVPQRASLFTGTLLDNLRMADPGADDARCWWALDQAGLAEVHAWPEGLDTRVGERGTSVSGGQAQRIAIARAFLRDAPIMLLDEPTSQIDLASEHAVLEALHRLTRDRTVITVTHRAAALEDADGVVALTDGTFTEVAR